MNESDLALTFVESCCYVEPGLSIRAKDLWDAYKEWSLATHLMQLTQHKLYRRLEAHFKHKKNPITFFNIGLKLDEQWDFWEIEEVRKVYFITDGNAIKIGVSQDPETRMKFLQTASSEKLILLGWTDGGYEKEAEIQTLFANKKGKGGSEWFHITPNDLRAKGFLIPGGQTVLKSA